jgi:signal transduction histidine kinase
VRLGLHGKILLLTAVPLAALVALSLWLVERGVATRTHQALRADLARAAGVFESMLAANAHELELAGAVIVRDPKFFSVLTLPHAADDPQFRATVAGVAQDFHHITRPDVFEVVDARGHRAATVGPVPLGPEARAVLTRAALGGRTLSCAVPQRGTHVLLVATPVVADGRVVGALILGREVGGPLAERLRELTSSEVTFLAAGRVTRTTLPPAEWSAAERSGMAAGAGGTEAPAEVTADGRWITLARPLPLAAEGSRQTYVLQRSIETETAFLRDVRSHLYELGTVILVVVILASLFIAGHLTGPIRQLVRAAEAMEAGRWDAPIHTTRRDEIGSLAVRFEQMRARQRVYVEGLEEMSRAKSEFIAVASHELRTPIAVIRGWEDLIRGGHVSPVTDRLRQALDAIDRACSTLERVALDATQMARADDAGHPPQLAPCDIVSLVDRVTADARGAAPDRRVALSGSVEPGLPAALLDGDRVAEALGALVRNGIRFTPDGGTVRVTGARRGAALELSVVDTGVGLSPDTVRRLRERSITPQDSRSHHTSYGLEFNVPGLGFGLSLARGVAEGHGGSLEFAGEEGRGSCFTLHFPAVFAAAEQEAA